jgi:hypothetical protein
MATPLSETHYRGSTHAPRAAPEEANWVIHRQRADPAGSLDLIDGARCDA